MSHGILQEKVLQNTALADPGISAEEKQKRGDALCELTAKFHKGGAAGYVVPAPDYDDVVYGTNTRVHEDSDPDDRLRGQMSPEQLQKVKSKEFQDLNRDLKFRQKSGDYPRRPEFKTKYYEIMRKSAHKQEMAEEESELKTKLRSRSQIIEQNEQAKKEDESKPEFMKVQLRKQQTPPS